jgi:hypothetical protein
MSGITLLNTNINPGQIVATGGANISIEYLKDDTQQTYNAFSLVNGGVKNSAGSLTYYVSSGSLTANSGFATSTLNAATGVITRLSFTGGSSNPQIANYTVSVKDANGRIATGFATFRFTAWPSTGAFEFAPTDSGFEVTKAVTPWAPLVATGGKPPYTYTLYSGSLPAGLSYSTSGIISGTPTTGNYPSYTGVEFKATDQLGNIIRTGTGNYTYNSSLTVRSRITSTANTSTLYFMRNRDMFSITNFAPGSNVNPFLTVSLGTLAYSYSSSINFGPYGLTYLSSSNWIGTPNTTSIAGITSTFTVSDSLGVNSVTTSTKIIKIAPEITAADGAAVSGNLTRGVAANLHILQASGGVPNWPSTPLKTGALYTYQQSGGTMPPGLSIVNTKNGGYVVGTPTTAGSFTIGVNVYDGNLSDRQTNPNVSPYAGTQVNQYAAYSRTFSFTVV